VAERALRKIGTAVDEGVYRPQQNIRFETWAEKWLDSLERKGTTVDSYRSTIKYATDAFGEVLVRRIGPGPPGEAQRSAEGAEAEAVGLDASEAPTRRARLSELRRRARLRRRRPEAAEGGAATA
jgi:hypothetical protein